MLGEATATCTMGKNCRGKELQCTPGPVFQGVRASSLPSPATGTAESWFDAGKGKMTPFQPQQVHHEDLQMPGCG